MICGYVIYRHTDAILRAIPETDGVRKRLEMRRSVHGPIKHPADLQKAIDEDARSKGSDNWTAALVVRVTKCRGCGDQGKGEKA